MEQEYRHLIVIKLLSDQPENREVIEIAAGIPVTLYTPDNFVSALQEFFFGLRDLEGTPFVRYPPKLLVEKTFTGATIYSLKARFSVKHQDKISSEYVPIYGYGLRDSKGSLK